MWRIGEWGPRLVPIRRMGEWRPRLVPIRRMGEWGPRLTPIRRIGESGTPLGGKSPSPSGPSAPSPPTRQHHAPPGSRPPRPRLHLRLHPRLDPTGSSPSWLASQPAGGAGEPRADAGAGVSASQITRWLRGGYLHHVLPGVYAVGNTADSIKADPAAAALYAGPRAARSHGTAAWWLKLTEREPVISDVTTPRRCQSPPRRRVHSRRAGERIWVRGPPTTSVIDTLLDLTATPRDVLLRRHGFIVRRYTWNQVNLDSGVVADDLRRALVERDTESK
jgi:hypothetical protein